MEDTTNQDTITDIEVPSSGANMGQYEEMDDNYVEIMPRTSDMDKILLNIESYPDKEKSQKILDNKDKIPEGLLRLAGNIPGAIDFVNGYIDNISPKYYLGESRKLDRYIPLYIQWDKRWGYEKYGDGILGITGCGPTSCAMIISGLLKDVTITPEQIAKIGNEEGYVDSAGTKWSFFPYIAKKYGLEVEEIPLNYDTIKKHLDNKEPIIVSLKDGNFTTTGHLLVLVDIDEDGNLTINDPNSIKVSEKKWSLEKVQNDINAMWAFSLKKNTDTNQNTDTNE